MSELLRVLLIEDDIGDAILVERALEKCKVGFEFQHCETLEAALSQLCHREFDVALLDLSLPDSFGLSALAKIRPHAVDMPIVVLTGLADDELALESLEQGAQDYLVKGIASPQLLERSLRYAIYRQQIQAENRRLLEEMETFARHDSLTGVLNRHSFAEQLDYEWKRAERYGKPLTSVLMDIDFFKRINDTYGHAVGDQFLKQVASTLGANTRSIDFVGRLGGEEFCVVLPETNEIDAIGWSERVRLAISKLVICVDTKDVSITISLGVAGRTDSMTQPQEMVNEADQAMFAAKRRGRNQVISSGHLSKFGKDHGSKLWNGLNAKQIMSPLTQALTPGHTLSDAVRFAQTNRVDTIPVVSIEGELSGVLGENDIMTAILASENSNRLIQEVMKTQVVSFSSDSSVREVCEFLCRTDVQQVFIVEHGKPIGYVRRANLIESIQLSGNSNQRGIPPESNPGMPTGANGEPSNLTNDNSIQSDIAMI